MYSEKQIYLLAVTDKNYVDGSSLLKDFFFIVGRNKKYNSLSQTDSLFFHYIKLFVKQNTFH
jgi:hypothetical protein